MLSKLDVFEFNDIISVRVPMFTRERFMKLKTLYPRVTQEELLVALREYFLYPTINGLRIKRFLLNNKRKRNIEIKKHPL